MDHRLLSLDLDPVMRMFGLLHTRYQIPGTRTVLEIPELPRVHGN